MFLKDIPKGEVGSICNRFSVSIFVLFLNHKITVCVCVGGGGAGEAKAPSDPPLPSNVVSGTAIAHVWVYVEAVAGRFPC